MLIRSFVFFCALLLAGFFGQPSGLAAPGDDLKESGSTQFPIELAWDSFAVWSGGAFLMVQSRFSGAPVFSAFDREGKLISQFTLTIPEARVHIVLDRAFARGTDGSLAIVGSAFSADSRGTGYFAWVSPDGRSQNVVRLAPFIPRAVTVAWDGTIWVAGYEKTEENQEPDQAQHVIRRYDKTGKLLGSYVLWSSLHVDPHRRPAEDSILVSSVDRVGWYSPFAHTYMEFSLGGTLLGQFRTDDHPKNFLPSVALCDDGGVFVGVPIYNGTKRTSFDIFALDRTRGEWTFVSRRNEKWATPYGCDGTRLATAVNPSTISWLEPAAKSTP